jgi:hypothetical protein
MEEGINNWLNYLNQNFRLEFGQDWDPGGTIRAGIKSDLDMISSGKIDWPKLVADGEQGSRLNKRNKTSGYKV